MKKNYNPNSKKGYGIELEIDIAKTLDGKKYCELTKEWKYRIKQLFHNNTFSQLDVIHAYKYYDSYAKPDIVIEVNGMSRKISVKCGKNPSVHMEELGDFLKFLLKIGVPDRIVRIIEFYHYGKSNKLSNRGKPFSREELISDFGEYLVEVNDYFDTHPEIVKYIIYRTVIKGVRKADPIDAIFYGNVENGFIITTHEIYDLILKEDKPTLMAPHFRGLVYQPSGRKVGSVDSRYSRIKWTILPVLYYSEDFRSTHK